MVTAVMAALGRTLEELPRPFSTLPATEMNVPADVWTELGRLIVKHTIIEINDNLEKRTVKGAALLPIMQTGIRAAVPVSAGL
jgi:hypothetical protein